MIQELLIIIQCILISINLCLVIVRRIQQFLYRNKSDRLFRFPYVLFHITPLILLAIIILYELSTLSAEACILPVYLWNNTDLFFYMISILLIFTTLSSFCDEIQTPRPIQKRITGVAALLSLFWIVSILILYNNSHFRGHVYVEGEPSFTNHTINSTILAFEEEACEPETKFEHSLFISPNSSCKSLSMQFLAWCLLLTIFFLLLVFLFYTIRECYRYIQDPSNYTHRTIRQNRFCNCDVKCCLVLSLVACLIGISSVITYGILCFYYGSEKENLRQTFPVLSIVMSTLQWTNISMQTQSQFLCLVARSVNDHESNIIYNTVELRG